MPQNKQTDKNKKIFIPIRIKITIPVVVTILVAGMVSGYSSFQFTQNSLLEREEILTDQINSSHAEKINTYLENKIDLIETIAQNNYLIDNVFNNPENIEAQTKILEGYNINNQYLAIMILDKEGLTLVSTDRSFVGNNYSFRKYFKSAIMGEPGIEVAIGITSKELGYYFSAPIKNGDQILGIIVLKLNPKEMDKVVVSEHYSTPEHLAAPIISQLTDDYGVILSSNIEQNKFKFMGNVPNNTLEKIIEERRYEGIILSNLDYNDIQNAITGSQPHLHSIHANGKRELLILNKIGDFPFYIICTSDLDEIYEYANTNAMTLGIAVLSAAIATLFALIWMINRVMKPLEALVKNIGEIEEEVQIDPELISIRGNDEIAKLARAIKNLAIKLIREKITIEDKVKQQTRQLEDQKMALMNILEDVQEEKLNTEIAKKDLDKFKLATDNVSEVVVITDPDGIILYANDAIEKVTGFTTEEIIGKKVGNRELWGGRMDKDFYINLWDTIKNKKQTFKTEVLNTRKSGEEYTAEMSINPILDADGNVLFFVAVERDITQLKAIDNMKTEFISLASHQLRTPLSAMKWFLEMLMDEDAGKLNKEQKDYLVDINASNERMIDLVNSLLDVSRIESGRIIVDPRPTDIKELIGGVIDELDKEIKKRNQTFSVDIEQNIGLLNIDPKLIRNVYQNLISNAIKFTPNEGKIELKVTVENNNILSEIKDTGYGIPQHEQEKVFKKFFRGENISTVVTDGNGLGLYMVKAIIESSKGEIWFESEINKGTTFWFTLPIEGMKPKKGTITLGA